MANDITTTLTALRARVPKAQPFLMYGLTEAFRSTYLPPSEIDRRPDSIGKAIPNAEVLGQWLLLAGLLATAPGLRRLGAFAACSAFSFR